MQQRIKKKSYMSPMAEQLVLSTEFHLLARASAEIDDLTLGGFDNEGDIDG